jgi:transcriptional regulator with XRE-family HTH domain
MAYSLGLSINAYANIEHGRSDLKAGKLQYIANLLGIRPYQIIVLAEELKQHGDLHGLAYAIKGIIRLSRIDLNNTKLTLEDQFLLSMDSSIRRSASC